MNSCCFKEYLYSKLVCFIASSAWFGAVYIVGLYSFLSFYSMEPNEEGDVVSQLSV